jgi:pimeloyl-ACP methyl ester carboxylesterase
MNYRTALRAGAALMFLTLAGATYQGVATALERRTFPRTGGMVAVGDHQLHISCMGDGSPTVVLEAPAAGMSAAWGAVQPDVAAITRVCAYDRAGLGWSERGDRPYDPVAMVGELRTLLEQAGEQAPFVVAGHGLGAAFATLFASRYATDTAALVLVDDATGSSRPAEPALLVRYPGALPWLARTGILRASGGLCSMTTRLPEPSGGALCAFLTRPDHLSRTADELSGWEAATALAADAKISATIPTSRLAVFGRDRVAFLGAPDSAPVVGAIRAAVEGARNAEAAAAGAATPDAP